MWLSIKFTHPDWRTICKNTLLGGHGKARRTVNAVLPQLPGIETRVLFTDYLFQHLIIAHTEYKALRRSVELNIL